MDISRAYDLGKEAVIALFITSISALLSSIKGLEDQLA
jgi:hypothetical protein